MQCILCKCDLSPVTIDGTFVGIYDHPEAEDCLVRLTDEYGVALDDRPRLDGEIELPSLERPSWGDIQLFPFVEDVFTTIFHNAGVKRLGGASTGEGWSSISTFQRCPYAWKRRYIDAARGNAEVDDILPSIEPTARAVGTVIHTFLAVYYMRMIDPSFPLTPKQVRDEALKHANPEFIHEGWRVFAAYALYYEGENIQPLAVEFDLVNPRTKKSCRFDLVAFFPEVQGDRLPGTYILEHKSTGRFDDTTLNGWANDGEVLGQVMNWKDLRLEKRFGPLRGVIVNILGKHKEPQFHRTTVAPETWQIDQHRRDIARTGHEVQLAVLNDDFPRRRAGCIHRYGKCDHYDHCATSET